MNQPTAGPLASHKLDAISAALGDHMQTILVVEDEPLVRLHVCSTLEEEGYTVLEAGCADAAIRLLTENDAVGVMLTDVRLPGRLDGLQLAQEVGQRWPAVGVVISSGLSEVDLQMPAGVTLLRKPFGVGALLNACHNAAVPAA